MAVLDFRIIPIERKNIRASIAHANLVRIVSFLSVIDKHCIAIDLRRIETGKGSISLMRNDADTCKKWNHRQNPRWSAIVAPCPCLSCSEFGSVCVCVWNIWIDVKLPINFNSRGTQHFTGTVSNEATSEMGYPAWPAGRTCNFRIFRQMATG